MISRALKTTNKFGIIFSLYSNYLKNLVFTTRTLTRRQLTKLSFFPAKTRITRPRVTVEPFRLEGMKIMPDRVNVLYDNF